MFKGVFMKKTLIIFCVVVGLQVAVQASEIMTSAKQLGIGRVGVVAYYTASAKEVDFGEYAKYDFIQAAYAVKASVKVWEGWHVYAKAGKFTPEIENVANSSLKYENKDDFDGTVFGGGVKYVLFPDTLVTPAVAVDIGVTQWSADINKFAGSVIVWKNELDITEIQGAVSVSKKLLMIDPYVGVKVFNTDVKWKTNVTVAGQTVNKEIEGDANGISPFVGVKFSPLPFISVIAEGSFATETNISVGIRVGF